MIDICNYSENSKICNKLKIPNLSNTAANTIVLDEQTEQQNIIAKENQSEEIMVTANTSVEELSGPPTEEDNRNYIIKQK